LLDASLLVCDGSSNKIGLTIYNNYVFWSDDRTGNYDIWAYDFNSGLTFAFVSAPGDQVLVPCQGFDNNIGSNFIVWQDGRNCSEQNPNNYDIYGKNLITGQIFIVSNSAKNEIEPVASGNKISWIEKDIIVDQNGKQTGWHDMVKTKDIGTGIISTISTSDTYKESICMNGDFIIWSESPDLNLINSTWDLKGYSNELFIEFPISIHSGDQFALSLSGNFVFWQDTRNDDGDLFYATLVVQP
jgi:beta propeller repeat protein